MGQRVDIDSNALAFQNSVSDWHCGLPFEQTLRGKPDRPSLSPAAVTGLPALRVRRLVLSVGGAAPERDSGGGRSSSAAWWHATMMARGRDAGQAELDQHRQGDGR